MKLGIVSNNGFILNVSVILTPQRRGTETQSAIYRDPSKKVKFSLGARLRETGEMFVVPDCHHNMRIRELKNAMELVVGIPTDFQRVCYLDNGQINTFDVICWFNC